MITQKLILKATAALTLVGLSGGLLAVEQPKKNEQLVYRFVKGTTNIFGTLAAYTAQTKFNFWKRSPKYFIPVSFGAFVAAPILRQTLFSIAPETNVQELVKKAVLHSKHDFEQAYKNVSPFVNPLIDRATPHAKTAVELAEKTAQEYKEIAKQNKKQQKELQDEKFQQVSNRTQEAGKNASLWVTDKAAAFAQWFKGLNK